MPLARLRRCYREPLLRRDEFRRGGDILLGQCEKPSGLPTSGFAASSASRVLTAKYVFAAATWAFRPSPASATWYAPNRVRR
ncbi:hypothetical protein AB0N93_36335 [Streptomyces sp. NPDC091267]|uniref:hypothetical protein n=1 Tax=Streptomyces sp. NPDC091267 TaxID=3155195 RepID=UPI00342A88AA